MIWILLGLGIFLLIRLVAALVCTFPLRMPSYVTVGQFNVPQENIEIQSEGHILRGWWIPSKGATTVAVMSHGYMMNRTELIPEAILLHGRGVSCLLYDFRAHGHSAGRVCTLGFQERNDVK